ncbi:MAG: hypothetical protein PHQ40_00480 [Anaerolineaceae bacterium]|nr:hypothetical protein [Anaerolineaceae bacterium]MDD5367532.1 hypothetical protein [Anaerolineaceae bacterium]
MPTYAKDTDVTADKSRTEIERILERYGATSFMYGWATGKAVVGFEIKGKRYRLVLPLPDKDDPSFRITESGRRRTSKEQILAAWEQACRQRWRALALVIKADLEADESGIRHFEEAWRNELVLPNGMTVGEWISPQIEQVYQTGHMPSMLPGIDPPRLGNGDVIDGEVE